MDIKIFQDLKNSDFRVLASKIVNKKISLYSLILASYDSTGSIPTTDVSMETYTSHVTQESTYPKQSRPTPHTDQPMKPVEDPFISPASHQVNTVHHVT